MLFTERLFQALKQGRAWELPADPVERDSERDGVRQLLRDVFEERYHKAGWSRVQARNATRMPDDGAAWAGLIGADNPASGPYQGTSWVWFPGDGGSVAVLVIGTGGFGADAHILGRPGHRRRLQALARIHGGHLWVKPDPLDLASRVPEPASRDWNIKPALDKYAHVIYAAVRVTDEPSCGVALDLLDLFMDERGIELKGECRTRWEQRRQEMMARLFPRLDEDEVSRILEERRFVILQGPPGTGKTRLGLRVAGRYGTPTAVQFHPARTYEDFVIGLAPQPASEGLRFTVRAGDLLIANGRAREGPHVLFIDEINRGDLSRVLGEAIFLFEASEPEREIQLPHPLDPATGQRALRLAPGLMVLGTRNTADRSIARIDLAIRRRFAFLDLWPDLDVVATEGDGLATACFSDTLNTFAEYADDAALSLVPGHAYFMDPRPDAAAEGRRGRIVRRLLYELIPLLRSYVEDRVLGPATAEIEGLADRIEAQVRAEAGPQVP